MSSSGWDDAKDESDGWNLNKPAASAPIKKTKKPRKKRRGLWWKIPLVLLTLLLLLVMLLPTLLSTSPVRRLVLRQAEGMINGTLDIDDWNFGWFTGIKLSGVRVLDTQMRNVVSIGRITVPLPLWKAAMMNLRFGEAAIENVTVRIEVDETGNTNLLRTLVGRSTPPAEAPATATNAGEPSMLPLLVGRLSVTGLHVEVRRLRKNADGEQELAGPVVSLMNSSSIAVDVDTERGHVAEKIRLALGIDDVGMGTITLDGDSRLLSGRKLDLDHLQAQQSLELHELDLSKLQPVLASLGLKLALTGIISGEVTMHAESGGSSAAAQGEIRMEGVGASGELVGEALTLPQLTVPLDVSFEKAGDGGRLTVKGTGVRIGSSSTVFVSADLPLDLLEDLKASGKPRSSGKVGLRVEIPDLGGLLGSLPAKLRASVPVEVTQGGLKASVDVALEPRDFTLNGKLVSTRLEARVQGKDAIALPLEATVQASMRPGEALVQAVHDVAVTVATRGFDLHIGAPTIGQVKVTANADVSQLREALGGLVDFGPLHGAKTTLVATCEGDVTAPGSPLLADVDLKINDVDVRLREGRTAELPRRLAVHIGSRLARNADGSAAGVKDGVLSLTVGDAEQPLLAACLDFAAELPADGGTPVPQRLIGAVKSAQLSLKQLDVDLAQAWAVASEVAAMPSDVALARGTLSITAGCELGVGADTSLHVASSDVRMKRASGMVDAPPLNLDIRCLAGRNAAGLSVVVKELALAVGKAMTLKTKQALFAELPQGKPPVASGALRLEVDLSEVDRLKRLFTGEGMVPASAKGFAFREGTIGADLALNTAASGQLVATVAMGVDAAVAVPGGMLREHVSTDLKVTAAAGFTDADVEMKIDTRLFNLAIEKVHLALKPVAGGTVFDLLPKAKLHLRVPDLKAVEKTLAVLSPAPAIAPAGQDAPQLAAGDLEIIADLTRSGSASKLTVESRLNNAVLSAGSHSYRFTKPQVVHLATELVTATQADGSDAPDVLSQLASVSLSELRAELDVGTLSLAKPVTVDAPARLLASDKAGMTLPPVTVVFAGDFDSVAAIGESLFGKAKGTWLPVSGGFTITQGVSLAAGRISVDGELKLDNFRFRQGNVEVHETGITLVDKFAFDPARGALTLQDLSLGLDSGAMKASITGEVTGATTTHPQLAHVELHLLPDWAKLWAMVKPLLSPDQQQQMADLALQGTQECIVRVDGTIATAEPTPAGMLGDLKVDIDLAIQSVKWPSQGITLEEFTLPVDLVAGQVYTQHRLRPDAPAYKPATLNEGKLDLSEFTLDVFAAHPRLSSPANKTVLKDIHLNQVLAKAMANVSTLFVNPKEASGRVDLVLVDCTRFPLDDLMNSMGPENDGRLELLLSVAELELTSDGLSSLMQLGGFTSPGEAGGSAKLRGDIKDGRVTVGKGWLTHNIDLQLAQHHMLCNGELELGRKYYKQMTVDIPGAMLTGGMKLSGTPERVALKFHGPANALSLDKSALGKDLVKDAAGNVLDGAIKSTGWSKP